MAERVGPDERRPTHDISLERDGVKVSLILTDSRGKHTLRGMRQSPYPQTTLRVSQNAPGYSDMEMPYTPIVQQDWSGGRGQADFEENTTRFYDSFRADTTHGDIIPGPKETKATGYFGLLVIATPNNGDYLLNGGASGKMAASSMTTGAPLMARRVRVRLRNASGATYPLKIRAHIYSDSADAPGSLLASTSWLTIPSLTSVYQDFDLDITLSMDTGTKYWVAVEIEAGKRVNVAKRTSVDANSIQGKTTGDWAVEADVQALTLSLTTVASGRAIFFEYKGALYAVTAPDDYSAPRFYINGYRGVATSNSADRSLTNTKLSLYNIDLTGKVIKIVDGKGSLEAQPWRVITGNTQTGTNDSISVNPKWKITQDATTQFVIKGCDTWMDMNNLAAFYANYLKYPITDVLVLDDRVYFAQNYDQTDGYIVRFRHSISGGNLASTFANDGTNKARFLTMIITSGVKKIWATTGRNDVKSASVPAWGTNLSFGSVINCGSENEAITSMCPYGTPAIPHIFKEGGFGNISNGQYGEIPLGEMMALRNDTTGQAWARNDVYLYFSLLNGLLRYYNQNVDTVGPDLDEGLPDARRGPIAHMISYPGRIYAAIDGGDEGDSCILCHTPGTDGWHEIYRAPRGKRIRSLYIETIPGKIIGRLWVSQEEELIYLPLVPNPRKATGYLFAETCHVVSSWIYGSFRDVVKFWKSVCLFSENLSPDHRTVTLEYQTDQETDTDEWHALATTFDTSPKQEADLSPELQDVKGTRWRYRLTLATDEPLLYPRVKALRIDPVTRTPPKNSWNVTFKLSAGQVDLQGRVQQAEAAEIYEQLKKWSDSREEARPLKLHSNYGVFDDFWVFIEPASLQPLEAIEDKREIALLAQMTLTEA